MTDIFADRMTGASDSFIREILKVTNKPEVISFAGGLPNPDLFPVEAFAEASARVIRNSGRQVLQYSTTEGYLPLREYLADQYARRDGLKIDPDEILIVNGSQQGIDLVSKIFLNKREHVVVEKPGYVGAIQSISLFEPVIHMVPLQETGIDCDRLEAVLAENPVKLLYAVPSFQNPSGVTYTDEVRKKLASLLQKYSVYLLEDNPYGDLRFMGSHQHPIKKELGETGVLMGSFSKITVPGIRLGWVCAEKKIMDKLKIVKQAADLHSNYLAQRIMFEFLSNNDLDRHIQTIIDVYGAQRNSMVSAMDKHFPDGTGFTRPEGGMFLWVTLPDDKSSLQLFDRAIKQNVAFVPGPAFHLNGEGDNSFRLNYSNSNRDQIEEGIKRLASAI